MMDARTAEQFESERARLNAVAYRLLGSASEAQDAVQEAWLRLQRADAGELTNPAGWLTTVVARICLDTLRARRTRREEPLEAAGEAAHDAAGPEGEAVLAESVGIAMLAVLERLVPAERVAFVLHDVFDMPFEEIAGIVGRTPVAARQLASRGRRRVHGAPPENAARDMARHREVVAAFFRASRSGDFEALLALLDPDAVLRPDAEALRMGARNGWISGEVRGAQAVARQLAGQAQGAELALIDGLPGAVWAPGGTPRVAFVVTVAAGRVAAIELMADARWLAGHRIELLQ